MTNQRSKKRMGGIFLLLLMGAGLVGGAAYLRKVWGLKGEISDYIEANSAETAVAAYTFDEKGQLVADGYTLFRNADTPLVMASTMKIAVLAAYEEAVAAGALDPNEPIPVAEWERFYLPLTDGGAHALGLKSLGLAADALGFAQNQGAVVPLDDLVRVMMHYSGNAATDYLLARLGDRRMTAVLQQVGLVHHSPIKSLLGASLVIFNHEAALYDLGRMEEMVTAVANADYAEPERLADLYLNDADWRAAQIAFMTTLGNDSGVSAEQVWAYHLAASQLLPRGTAREYAHLMAHIASGQLISAQVSAAMQDKLETVPDDWPMRALYFDRFGEKGGMTAGVLTLASYAVPKRGALAGQQRVVVLLTNQLPLEVWQPQGQFEGVYLLQADLARGLDVFENMTASLAETTRAVE